MNALVGYALVRISEPYAPVGQETPGTTMTSRLASYSTRKQGTALTRKAPTF